MSARSYFTVWCDNTTRGDDCTQFVDTEYRTATRARIVAKAQGWRTNIPGGRDLCPQHDRLLDDKPAQDVGVKR